MIQDVNLIKLKSDNGIFYIFDAIDNNIYQVEESDFKTISQNDLGRTSGIRESIKADTKKIKNAVNNEAKTLIIEITEKCNLRCSYCIFDDSDNSERNHSQSSICIEDAKNAIMSYIKRNNDNNLYIVFYGGEPLLEFEKLKEIVRFTNKQTNKNTNYSISTNASSLNKDKVDFLVKNKILTTVSIDGPKFINDKNRKKPNGSGSFDSIRKNILSIKNEHPEFYNEKIFFNCVISTPEDIEPINIFFENDTLFPSEKVRFSPEIENSNNINAEIRNRSTSLYNRSSNAIEKAFIKSVIDKIRYRQIGENAGDRKKHCIPFSNRTYIRSDGSIQYCERIQDSNKVIITDSTKLDMISENIFKDFIDFKKSDCSRCFAYNFCEMCPASFMRNGILDKKESLEKCSAFREDILLALNIYINQMENRL